MMALQVSLSSSSICSSTTFGGGGGGWGTNVTLPPDHLGCSSVRVCGTKNLLGWRRGVRSFCRVKSSLEVVVGKVTEVNKDTFWPLVNAAGDKIVVLDMYTQWCGPCKVIAPKFQELSEKYLDVVFMKLDCNEDNKPLAKELGIKAVPTFKFLKDSKIVKEVTGAKLDDIVLAIETLKSS